VIKLSFSKEKKKKDTKEKWSQQYLTQIVIEGISASGTKKSCSKAEKVAGLKSKASKKRR
jgi:large subunit ribosomal protein L21